MTSAKTVKIAAIASTQRLRRRSQNSLRAMTRMGRSSIAGMNAIVLLLRVAEKHVLQRWLLDVQIVEQVIGRQQRAQHRHLVMLAAGNRDFATRTVAH